MSKQDFINTIYLFITNTFDNYDYERLQYYNEIYENISYIDFLEHQMDNLNNLSLNKLFKIINIITLINNNDFLYLTDEESFAEFLSKSIYFNLENKLVITNHR